MKAVLLVPALAVVACGSQAAPAPDAAASPRETVTGTKTLRPGELGEATLTGGPADRAVIRLRAAGRTFDFNIHGHAGGSIQNLHEELGVDAVDYTFVPAGAADWFVLLRNAAGSGATIEVQVELALYGAMTWSDWQ